MSPAGTSAQHHPTWTETVFEGLFSPAHLAILAVVLFVVIGPRRVVDRWHSTTKRIGQLADGETQNTETKPPDPTTSTGFAYRLGRRLHRR